MTTETNTSTEEATGTTLTPSEQLTQLHETKKITTTEYEIAKMLIENTGRHFLDSGGAYGRSWERNQALPFLARPATTLSFRRGELDITHNVYHWLAERLDYDAKLNELFHGPFREECDREECRTCGGRGRFGHERFARLSSYDRQYNVVDEGPDGAYKCKSCDGKGKVVSDKGWLELMEEFPTWYAGWLAKENAEMVECDECDGDGVKSAADYAYKYTAYQDALIKASIEDVHPHPLIRWTAIKAQVPYDVIRAWARVGDLHLLVERLGAVDATVTCQGCKGKGEVLEVPEPPSIGGIYGDGNPVTVNTYNNEDLLSQTIQFTYFEVEHGDAIVMLQIHGGCDVRGGYTAPKLFTLGGNSEYAIFDNAKAGIGCGGKETNPWYDPNAPEQLELPGQPPQKKGVRGDAEDYHSWYSDDGHSLYSSNGEMEFPKRADWIEVNPTKWEELFNALDEEDRASTKPNDILEGIVKMWVHGNLCYTDEEITVRGEKVPAGTGFCPHCGGVLTAGSYSGARRHRGGVASLW
jgi:hypothetical protein